MNGEELAAELTSLDFARTPEEAEQRSALTRSADPYPEIESALLNSADLLSYIAATAMIYPFSIDPDEPSKTLKPASCAVSVLGPYLVWRGSGRDRHPDPPEVAQLDPGEELVLERNSIVYATLEPTFRLPDYVAGRFNLTIRDVYRGMLVGTGPLVDPGFQGRLSLPLHNLTANDYVVTGGEPLVWMEFTKLSPHPRWGATPPAPPRSTAFVPFPHRKLDRRTVRDYVRFAHDGPIRSSIPEMFGESTAAAARASAEASTAAHAADSARGEALKVRQTVFNWSLAAFIAVVISLAALLLQGLGYIDDARDDVDTTKRENLELKQTVDDHADALAKLQARVRALRRARND